MSVIIKGMEMPKSCDECRIMVFEDTNCVPELFCGCPIVFKAHPQSVGHRPDYCPLVEVQEQMKWIPVTERLPEKDQEVLIFLFGEDPYIAWHNGEYWCTEDFRLDEPDDWQPTHWFPLPKQPESEGE